MSGARTIHLLVSVTIDPSGTEAQEKIDIPASFRTEFTDDPVILAAREILSMEVTSAASYDLLDTKIFTDILASRFDIHLYGRQISDLMHHIGMHRLGKYRDGAITRNFYSENPAKYQLGKRINPRAIKNALTS